MEKEGNSTSIIKAIVGLILIILVIVAGVFIKNEFGGGIQEELNEIPTPVPLQSRVSLVVDNIPVLPSGHYRVDVVSDEPSIGVNGTVTVGTFVIDKDGKMETLMGEPIVNNEFAVDEDLGSVNGMVRIVTVSDNGSSESILLQGDLQDGIGALEFGASNLTDASGSFILSTPSDGPNTNETSGVWFVKKNEGAEDSVSLLLPAAPEGWVYEAWVVHNGQVFSMGQFSAGDVADNANRYTANESLPQFPGEDFLVNPPDAVTFPLILTTDGTRVLITVEPLYHAVADESLNMQIFSAILSSSSQPDVSYELENVAGDYLPSGLAIVRR